MFHSETKETVHFADMGAIISRWKVSQWAWKEKHPTIPPYKQQTHIMYTCQVAMSQEDSGFFLKGFYKLEKKEGKIRKNH